MKEVFLRILKYLGIFVALLLLLFGLITWVVFQNRNDWLLEQIQSYMEKTQSAQLDIASIDLKLFKGFPDVTIELGGINYFLKEDSLQGPNESILRAEKLFVAIELLPLINEELNVSQVSLVNSQVNIVELENGVLNLDLALAKPSQSKLKVKQKKVKRKPVGGTSTPKATPSTEPSIQVNLENVNLNDMLLTWHSFANPEPAQIKIKKMGAEFSWVGKMLTAKFNSLCEMLALKIRDTKLPTGNLMFGINFQYDTDSQLLTVMESKVQYEKFSILVNGTYTHRKNRMLDMHIDASANDMELLSLLIKKDIIDQNPNSLKEGDIYFNGRVFGELKDQQPQIEVSFGAKNLGLELPKDLGAFKEIGFEGRYSSGNKNDLSEAKLEINNLKGELPGGFLKGGFHLHNFAEPYLKYKLDAQFKVDGYDQIFKLDFLRQLKGNISVNANFDGPLKLFGKHEMDSSRSSTIKFDSLTFIVTQTNQLVSGMSGKLETVDNKTLLRQLAITYGKNDLLIDAAIDNLPYFLFKRESDISISGHLQSNVLFTKDFIPDTLQNAVVQDKISNLTFNFKFNTIPKQIVTPSSFPDIAFEINDLTFNLDKLPDVKKIEAKGVFGETSSGFKLNLQDFHADMPTGKLDVTGDLFIPEKRLWHFNAHVNASKFPWTYINELIAEIREDKEPGAKNLPFNEMEMVTADLDLSASVITFPFDIKKLVVRNSQIYYSEPGSKPVSVEKLNASMDHVFFEHPENSGAISGLKSTKGSADMRLSVSGLNKLDVKMNATGKDNLLEINFLSAIPRVKSENGTLTLDMSGQEPQYHINFMVMGANLEQYIMKFYKKKVMDGDINYSLDLRTSGSSWDQVKRNLVGDVTITGDSLRFYGINIDRVLKKYERSQNFNLTDVGAVLVAGPLGLAVTKGTDFVSLASINFDSAQQTKIKTLNANWRLENQQLTTEDVAFATFENRIAFDGQIDFASDSIPGLTIAVVDKNGCSLMDQKLYGKMNDLKTGKINIAKKLFGSVINFVNAVVGQDCEPVYTGRVKAPLP